MSWSFILFIILLAGYISLAFFNWRTASLLLLVLLPSYVWRVSLAGWPTNFLEVSILTGALVVIYKNWQNFKWPSQLKNAWPGLIYLLILTSGLIGVLMSRDLRLALGIYKGWIIAPLILTWLVYYALKIETIPQALIKIGYSLLLGLSASSLYAIASGFINNNLTRVHGLYDSPNVLAMFLVPVIAYVIALIYLYKNQIKYLPYWYVGLALGLIALIMSNSWGGLGALVMTLVALVVLNKYPVKKLVVLCLSSIILVGWLFPVYVIQHQSWPTISRVNQATKITSGQVRYILWREAAKVGQDHWLLGSGLGQWQPIFKTYIERNLPEVRNRYLAVELYYASLFPHNLWLTTWLYLGVLGVASFIALAFYSSLSLIKHKEFILTLALILPILLHGIIDTPVFKNDSAVLWFLPLVLSLIIQVQSLNKQTTYVD